jgi:hypothetical protein
MKHWKLPESRAFAEALAGLASDAPGLALFEATQLDGSSGATTARRSRDRAGLA